MQALILTCVFGALGVMVLWVAGTAAVTRDQMMQRGGKLAPPEDF